MNTEPTKMQQNLDYEEMLKELSGCQLELRDLLWKANNSTKKEQTKILATVDKVIEKIEGIKNKIPVENIESGEIIHSLEFQKCLSTKFSQLLISIYKSDPKAIERWASNFLSKIILIT